ncbi:MAG: ABC transporter permease [Deltaproteobacteria bacterium]|nr:ABC transporter permease [Deltaproteobacteria bacterium]
MKPRGGGMAFSARPGAIAALVLAAIHVVLALLPAPPLSPALNLVLFATNLYVLYCAAQVLKRRSGAWLALFLLGYVALFLLTMVYLGKKPLFILLVVAYASVFGSPVLLGFFGIFVLCFVILQPYGFETFIPLALVYAIVWRARRSASRFALLCLGAGLVGMFAVLFPLIHLALQDSAQTLWRVFQRPEVRGAISTSLLSSTVATLICAAFGVPLAYALARLDFAGKRWVESLVDLPILVPQSVAGVALIVLLGPGSALGQGLASLGLGASGTFAGLVLAQVFVASPFLVKTAMTAFEAVPLELEQASRSLGHGAASTFARIAVPLAGRGLLVGAALAWARAVSEFGCVVLFASSPVSGPMLVHTEFLRAGLTESRPIAILLLVICLWIFVILQFGQSLMPFALQRRGGRP